MDTQTLESLLDEAFPLKPTPKLTLHQAVLADQTLERKISNLEWSSAAALDASRTWRDYSDRELISCEAGLAHLSENAFVYYAPAYLGFAARNINVDWKDDAWSTVGSVVFSFTNRSSYNLSRLKTLTARQREVVIQFLEQVVANDVTADNADDAKKALDRYWKTDEAAQPLIIVP